MGAPDQRLFESDIASAEFRMGVDRGVWGLAASDAIPPDLDWPSRILWVAAAARPNAPSRFHLLLDLKGYRSASPTGTLWDTGTKARLALERWPKGKSGSRFAMVFRTADWKHGEAFYHPYDRVAAQGHTEWPRQQPHLVWTPEHTIVDYLAEFHDLFQGGDYIGV